MNAGRIGATMAVAVLTTASCSLFVSLDGLESSDAGSASADASADHGTSPASDGGVESSTADGSTVSYASVILADAPLAYFDFDETSGPSLKDSSGHGHDATKHNGVTLGGAGAFSGSGTSAHFDGSGWIQIDDSVADGGTAFDFADHAPFTLEAWIELDTPAVKDSNEYTFFSKEKQVSSGNYNGIDFFAQPNLTLQREDDPVDETEANTAAGLGAISTWYYVVGSFDGTTLTIYVDLNVLATHDSESTTILVTDVPFIFGAEVATSDNSSLVGSMDEAAIYDKALTPAQLAAHFHAAGR